METNFHVSGAREGIIASVLELLADSRVYVASTGAQALERITQQYGFIC